MASKWVWMELSLQAMGYFPKYLEVSDFSTFLFSAYTDNRQRPVRLIYSASQKSEVDSSELMSICTFFGADAGAHGGGHTN